MQKVRAMKHSVLNGMSHLNFSPQSSRNTAEEEAKRVEEPEALKDRRTRPLNQLRKAHTRPKRQGQGLHGWYEILWVYIIAFRLVFYGTPERLNEWVSESCELSWCSFPLVCLVQLQCDYACFILLFYYVKNNFYYRKKKTTLLCNIEIFFL